MSSFHLKCGCLVNLIAESIFKTTWLLVVTAYYKALEQLHIHPRKRASFWVPAVLRLRKRFSRWIILGLLATLFFVFIYIFTLEYHTSMVLAAANSFWRWVWFPVWERKDGELSNIFWVEKRVIWGRFEVRVGWIWRLSEGWGYVGESLII